MECEFSEFSYGYAAIKEAEAALVQHYRPTAAPTLPSLRQEAGLGYDVELRYVGFALMLQVKRCQYVSRSHPRSITWAAMGGTHYRFTVDVTGHQHTTLRALETRLRSSRIASEILYAAPLFHQRTEFD